MEKKILRFKYNKFFLKYLSRIASRMNQYSNYPFRLVLDGDMQKINASLAIQLVDISLVR